MSDNLITLSNSCLVGDPVDVITGANTDIALDLLLTGPLPLNWQRFYNSAYHCQRFSLGWGHTHSFDKSLHFDTDGIRYVGPIGFSVGFPPLLRDDQESVQEGLCLRRITRQLFQVSTCAEPISEFEFTHPTQPALLKAIRRGQHSIQFSYNKDNQLIMLTDSLSRRIIVQTDTNGLLYSIVLEREPSKKNLLLIRYEYDTQGNLIKGTDTNGNSFRFEYDRDNRMTRKTDRRGYSFLFSYDRYSRCVHSHGEDGLLDVRMKYSPEKGQTVVIKRDGGKWTYGYNDKGELIYILDPYGGARTFIRNESGQVANEFDPVGNAIRYVYSIEGTLDLKVSTLGEIALPTEERPASQQRINAGSNPREWEFGIETTLQEFTGIWQPVTYSNIPPIFLNYLATDENFISGLPHLGVRSQVDGHLILNQSRDASGKSFYSETGQFIQQSDSHGHNRLWRWDPNGNVEQYTDYQGSYYSYEYISWNLLGRIKGPTGYSIEITYTPTELPSSIVDSEGNRTDYDYDQKDRIIRVHRNGYIHESFLYDAADNVVERIDALGNTLVVWERGLAGLPKTRQLASGDVHNYGYDPSGRFIYATCSTTEVRFAYDEQGHLIEDVRNNVGITNRYEGNRLRQSTVLNRFKIFYDYEGKGILSITDPTGDKHKLEFFKNGIVVRTMYNGTCEMSQYDTEGRCLLKALSRGHSPFTPWTRSYKYSCEGDLILVEDNLLGNLTYEYNAAHRLSSMIVPGLGKQTFNYDSAGNLIEQPGLNSVSILPGNRLRTANGDRLEHNIRGHISTRSTHRGTIQYHYDSLDMLIRCDLPNGSCTYQYDALGRRVSKTMGSRRTDFFWDMHRIAAETNSDGGLRIYIYTNASALTPIMFVDYDSIYSEPREGRPFFIFCNQIATPVLVQDVNGERVWSSQLSPYGTADIEYNTLGEMPLRFPGHYFDNETNLHYSLYRYYCPEFGRYIQSDPEDLGSSFNLYAYLPNPLTDVDIWGLGCPGRSRLQQIGDFFTQLWPFGKPRSGRYPIATLRQWAQNIVNRSRALRELQGIFNTGSLFEPGQEQALRNTRDQFVQNLQDRDGVRVTPISDSDPRARQLGLSDENPGAIIGNNEIAIQQNMYNNNPQGSLSEIGHELGAIETNRQWTGASDITSGTSQGHAFRNQIPSADQDCVLGTPSLTHAVDQNVQGEQLPADHRMRAWDQIIGT